ncbi:MAG: flagellin FliC [Burkholderiales bacterium]|nr:flagellin FliC [Burkholderiales bacterium]
MAMTINTNVMSLNAQRNAASTQISMATTMQRLSSGLRVNNAKDDAAGLAIADRMNTQVRGMNVAIRNSNDGLSLVQVADGGLATMTDALQRMRELAVQSLNGTNTSTDRAALNTEYAQLVSEVSRIADATQFNGVSILGASAQAFTFQVGANVSQIISVTTGAVNTAMATTIDTLSAAASALAEIDTRLKTINTNRATYGAAMSRFEYTITNLRNAVENQSAARGRIMDADFAAETANLSRTQILQQAGTAMIAQANQMPQNVMRLLQG